MAKFRNALCCASALVALFATTGAHAQQSNAEYVVVRAHIDNVMTPHTVFDVAADCTGNEMCAAALQAISSISGYPIDKAVAVAAVFSTANYGEGTGITVQLPAGYRYCSARFELTSIVPRDGDRGSTLLLEARDNGLFLETWTPRRNPFDGRSWVEGHATVVGVRSDLADAAYPGRTPCYQGNNRHFLWCRGSGCEGQIVDVGRRIDMSGPPGAGQRRQ